MYILHIFVNPDNFLESLLRRSLSRARGKRESRILGRQGGALFGNANCLRGSDGFLTARNEGPAAAVAAGPSLFARQFVRQPRHPGAAASRGSAGMANLSKSGRRPAIIL